MNQINNLSPFGDNNMNRIRDKTRARKRSSTYIEQLTYAISELNK